MGVLLVKERNFSPSRDSGQNADGGSCKPTTKMERGALVSLGAPVQPFGFHMGPIRSSCSCLCFNNIRWNLLVVLVEVFSNARLAAECAL